jgi:hypothetical protein
MHYIKISQDLDAPAELVWDMLRDFAHIERWWPTHDPAVQIDHVDLEGEGIGQIRHIYNVGYPDPVSERLDFLDPATMTYKLSIVGRPPMGITHYQATGHIESLGEGRSRLNYSSEFTTESGKPDEAESWLRMAYALMFRGVADAAARALAQSGSAAPG